MLNIADVDAGAQLLALILFAPDAFLSVLVAIFTG